MSVAISIRVVILALLAVAAMGGCLPALPHVEARATPRFDPLVFFDGRTEGVGTLHIRGRASAAVRVESVGTRTADGLRLVQLIRLGNRPPRERTFTFAPAGPGRYTGTLTEASGPVEATVDGDRLTIRYRSGRWTSIEQHLTLRPDGAVADNRLTARVLGVPVARITEEIRRVERR